MASTENKQGFTIATATAMLPLVSRIVDELVILAQEISDTQERLAFTVSDRDNQVDVYSKELRAVEVETDKKSLLLEGCIDELLELNTLTGRVTEGFVDFPALRNEEKIWSTNLASNAGWSICSWCKSPWKDNWPVPGRF